MFSFYFHILLNFIRNCRTNFSLFLENKCLNRCIIGRWQYKVRYARFFHESIFVFCQWEEQRVMGCGLGKSKLQLSKRDKGVGIKERSNCVTPKIFLFNLKASSYFLDDLSFAVSISVPGKHHFYLADCLKMFWWETLFIILTFAILPLNAPCKAATGEFSDNSKTKHSTWPWMDNVIAGYERLMPHAFSYQRSEQLCWSSAGTDSM